MPETLEESILPAGIASLAHVIAGSTEVAYLVARGAATWGDCFGRFIFPRRWGTR